MDNMRFKERQDGDLSGSDSVANDVILRLYQGERER